MQEIRDLIKNGQYTVAERLLRERLSDTPDNAEALNMYGVALAGRGDVIGARSHFKRAIDAAPQEPSYLVNYGLLLAQQGDSLRAAEFLERATMLDPNWSRSHAQLGELALAAGQIESAEQRFRTALRANPDDAQALVGLAQVTLVRGDADQALTHAQRAIVTLADDARAQAVLGMVLLAKGHHAFARTAFDNSLRLDPANLRVRRLAAGAQLADGDLSTALASMNGISDFSREDASTLRKLTEALLRAGRMEETIALLDRALVRLPEDTGLVHAAAEARARLGRLDAAISLLAAYTSREGHASLWSHRLGLLARAGRLDEAYDLSKQWREAQPQQAEAHAEFATGAEMRGETALARAAAETALSLDPQQPKALTIATAYELRAGKIGPHFAALTALDPEKANPTVRNTRSFLLGYGADRQGDSDTAVRHWMDIQASLPTRRMPVLADPLSPPRELPMPLASESDPRPVVFIPHVPGTGAEALLRALARSKSIAVLSDRLIPNGRHDSLAPDQRAQIESGLSESVLRLFRRRYWRAFDRLKLPLTRIPVDVLPALEWVQYAALSAALPEARVLAFVRDPRDTLLHWIAYGTTPARPIGKPELAANYLLRQYQHLDRMRSSAGLAVTVVRAEDFDSDRNALRGRLAQALGVAAESLTLDTPKRQSLGSLPERLESGRWRQYAAPLSKAFRLLAPAARSFGYE